MILSEDASLKLGAACGASDERPLVSILLVNYKTPLQTKLCVRSLRKFTTQPHEVIVVDNGSEDESSSYLEGLRWIKLLKNTDPNPSHRNGLELARKAAKGSWILILHSDAFVRAAGWLEAILAFARPTDLMIASQDRVILPLDGPWGWTAQLSLWRTRRVRKMLWPAAAYPRSSSATAPSFDGRSLKSPSISASTCRFHRTGAATSIAVRISSATWSAADSTFAGLQESSSRLGSITSRARP